MKQMCSECGGSLIECREGAEFCCTSCRQAFQNRRLQRGAELYDLFMVQRFDRSRGRTMGAWTMMCALASHWRAEDRTKRAGRPSWTRPAKLAERLSWLKASTVGRWR